MLPKKIFSEKAGTTKNVLIDSMLIDAFDAEKGIDKSETATIGDSLSNQPITFLKRTVLYFPKKRTITIKVLNI